MKKGSLKKPAVIFVGFRHKTDSVQAARVAGYQTVLLTHKPSAQAKDLFDEIIVLDMKNADVILELIPQLKTKYRVRGVLTNYEHYVVLRSYIAEHLGVPTSSVYAASCTRNKALQRHALEFLPENIPARRVTNFEEAKKAWQELGKDCFVKNISGVKSKLIFHVQTEEELEEAVNAMTEGSKVPDEDLYDAYEFMQFHFRYPNPNKTFLVEKTVKGRLVSIDSIVGSRKIWHSPSLVDHVKASELGRNDSFLAYRLLPSKLKPDLIKRAKKVAGGAIRILGLKNCAVHTELMIDEEENIHLIELASRMGGYRQDMYMQAYDLDLSERLVKAVIGGDIKTRKRHKQHIAMLEFFAEDEGQIISIEGIGENKLPEGIELISFKQALESHNVGPAKLGYPPAARMMLSGTGHKALARYCRELSEKVHVNVS
ncbi:MAG: biotin carboxylase [Oceanicoccus sp.]|jgi:biotin carboxylase